MSKLNKLISKVQKNHPNLQFTPGETYHFHPPEQIFYNPNYENAELLLLHELGHYLNEDEDFNSEIALIQIESSAWETAKAQAAKYKIEWDEDFIQSRLDTYRDWLHNSSLCPNCKLNGYQDSNGLFHCPLCAKQWNK